MNVFEGFWRALGWVFVAYDWTASAPTFVQVAIGVMLGVIGLVTIGFAIVLLATLLAKLTSP